MNRNRYNAVIPFIIFCLGIPGCQVRTAAAQENLPGVAAGGDAESRSLITLVNPDDPELKHPSVQEVIRLRERGLHALLSGDAAADTDSYSSTFVANTPDRGVLKRDELLPFFASGAVRYDDIHQNIEYAAAHGEGTVVLMGVEIVVPGAGLGDAGKHVHRRFTDIFRYENGKWRHDLRHANVVLVE